MYNRLIARVDLFSFWREKEKEWRRNITVKEVSEATGISRNTINSYLQQDVERPDLEVIGKLCQFFGVPPGPVPFLVYLPDGLE